jgi:diaminopimelate epimerase
VVCPKDALPSLSLRGTRLTLERMRFAKGHGTQNDFVILPDPDGTLDLSPRLVARLCDRREGLGADGVLRAVRTGSAADPGWFMDYRNADGSAAEMCGNGIRVFACYLLGKGMATGGELTVGTRAGPRTVRVVPGGFTVDMGQAVVLGTGRTMVAGERYEGVRVSVGNPHLACLVEAPLEKFDLSVPPELDPGQFPAGGNVELVRVTDRAAVQMRVHERGSGETRSCGTGAVAAAVAAAHAAGQPAGSWRVGVPGGDLTVTLAADTAWLTGPAVIVAEGEIREDWLSAPT